MKRKRIAISLIVILALIFVSASSYADEKSELESKLKNANQSVKDAKQEYQDRSAKEQSLAKKISDLEAAILNTENELKDVREDIKKNNKKIDTVTIEVNRFEAEVGTQNSELMDRLRMMYTAGDSSILEVLLNSEDIVDFLSNLDMIQKIHAQDAKLLDELNAKLDAVAQKKAELIQIKEMLNQHKEAEKQKKAKLAEEKKELAAAKAKAHADATEALKDLELMEQASKSIEKELKDLKSHGTYGGGKMGWPVIGSVTSEYGWRIHPISGTRKFHAGIDIAAATGTPIHAAASGTVIKAAYSGGYGNVVIIDHGSGITTLYGHNSSYASSVGKSVKRGDVIAYAGSTGNSTGPHCHFEVRVNGATQNPRNWL
ncbi:MAG: peptidoglycan DD-metalloendopeptidase family protein [Clostridiales Family XIII bacterium]|jgi:murein DD-endopeptidase MepM/ murein hydrolase activator NlpD|nr:peptidoglycan DD-metalloendopeptidase family protein [Clostridiales Family XIII bacterium]